MPNNKAGGQKYRETMIKKHGSVEAWKQWQRSIAAQGGRNSGTGGFGAKLNCDGECGFDDELGLDHRVAQCSGKKGGLKSRRGPAKKESK